MSKDARESTELVRIWRGEIDSPYPNTKQEFDDSAISRARDSDGADMRTISR